MFLRNSCRGALSLANVMCVAPAKRFLQKIYPGAVILGFHYEMAPRVSHLTLTPDVIAPLNWAWDSLVDLLV